MKDLSTGNMHKHLAITLGWEYLSRVLQSSLWRKPGGPTSDHHVKKEHKGND